MTDALVAETIDAPSAAAATPLRMRPIDFSRKEMLDRGRLRTFGPVLDGITHRFSTAASASLRQSVHFALDERDIFQLPWEEYATTLPEATAISGMPILSLDSKFLIHLGVQCSVEMLHYFFGGEPTTVPQRETLTELERDLIVPAILEPLWGALQGAFEGVDTLTTGAMQNTTNALLQQGLGPGDLCLVLRLKVSINDREPLSVDLVLPIVAIVPLINRLEEQQMSELSRGSEDEAATRLEQMPVEIRFSYPHVYATIKEVEELQVGDIIPISEGPAPSLILVIDEEIVGSASIERDDPSPMLCNILTSEVAK